MAEGECGGGEHLHPGEQDVRRTGNRLLAQGLGEDEHSQPHGRADHRHDEQAADGGHAHVEVLQTLEQQHRGDDDRTCGGDEGNPPLQGRMGADGSAFGGGILGGGVDLCVDGSLGSGDRGEHVRLQRVRQRLAEHILLDQSVDDERGESAEGGGEHPGDRDLSDLGPLHHGESAGAGDEADGQGCTDDAADDGVRRRHRPAHPRCHEQPHCGAEEGRHHDEREVHRVDRHPAEVDDSALDRVGDVTAGEQGAADLEDCGDEQCLLHRQGAGADGGAEGVGDVVAADVEGHEGTEDDRGDEHHAGCVAAHEVEGPQGEGDEGDRQQATEGQMPEAVVAAADGRRWSVALRCQNLGHSFS